MNYRHLLLLSLVAMSLNGCGFRLMDTKPLQERYQQIAFMGNDNDILYKELKRRLLLDGVNVIAVTGSPNDYLAQDIPVLSCGNLSSKEQVMSIGSNSQTLEYNNRMAASCSLLLKDHRPYILQNSMNRSYVSKSGSTLSSHSEKNLLKDESAEMLADEILFRLRNYHMIEGNYLQNTEETTLEEEPVKVVFNATSADETTTEINVTKDNASEVLQLTPEDAHKYGNQHSDSTLPQ